MLHFQTCRSYLKWYWKSKLQQFQNAQSPFFFHLATLCCWYRMVLMVLVWLSLRCPCLACLLISCLTSKRRPESTSTVVHKTKTKTVIMYNKNKYHSWTQLVYTSTNNTSNHEITLCMIPNVKINVNIDESSKILSSRHWFFLATPRYDKWPNQSAWVLLHYLVLHMRSTSSLYCIRISNVSICSLLLAWCNFNVNALVLCPSPIWYWGGKHCP